MSMHRYFLEVFYKGSGFSGFQKQQNANSIQSEIEKAFLTLQKKQIKLTGSSRTDTGVHALQNFFHFDFEGIIHPEMLYKLNAILPSEIVAVTVKEVSANAHCRFDATGRAYKYYLYQHKNPFLEDRAYYFPYTMDLEKLNEAAKILMEYQDFSSFAKRNSQVKNFLCTIKKSEWVKEKDVWIYSVTSNRFLRGMVKGLTGTMLQVGRGKINLKDLRNIIESMDCTEAYFSVPAHALFLEKVEYPDDIFLTG